MSGARGVLFFSWLFACAASAAGAVSPWSNVADPVFQRIDQKTLPHPAVYAVAQDAAGFIWVGTPAGLARYDGYRFRTFLPKEKGSESPPGVESLLADPNGTLWIGTLSSGLMSLDESTETFHVWRPDPAGRTGPRSATIIALARASDGRIWVGGDAGLDSFDPSAGRFEPADVADSSEAQPRVEAILIDRERAVWAATVRGLYRRAPSEKTFRPFVPEGGGSFRSRAFFSLSEDAAGRLWIGSLDAVFVLDAERGLARTYSSGNDRSALAPGEQWGVIEVAPGVFWVACYDGGISIVDDATQRVRRIAIDRANPGGLTPGDVWQFFRDRSGLIWVANGPGGLLVHNPANRGIDELTSSDKHLGAGDIGARAVAAAPDGTLWLGGSDRVANLDPRTGASTAFTVPNHPSVQTLRSGADGTLWIGTMEGLCRLPLGGRAVECPQGPYRTLDRVFALVESGGTLWVGTGAGVAALDERSGGVTRYRHGDSPETMSNDFATVLYADRAGRIWAGTRNGLDRIDPRTGRVTRFVHDPRNPNSLGTGAVSSIVQDRGGRIWAGAVGGPLNVLTESGDGGAIVRRLGDAEGLPEHVDGLAQGADGKIWASATNVLARIDPETFRTRILGPADGIDETEFWTGAVAAARDGTIFFAGTRAVAAIEPGASSEWSYSPPVAITELTLGGRSVTAGTRRGGFFDLPAGLRDITVEFASLDYSAPDALRYAYKLEGYNRDWISADSAHRLATYTNLAPGTYTLRVRGTNRRGTWSSSAIALGLRSLPSWYETWWFRAAIAGILLAAILALVRARTGVLRRRAARLEEIVADRTSELAKANAALEDMTITDALTGLRNRRFLMQRIDEDVALAVRQETDLVFFLVDIDHFKSVNDELGHAAGDRVLEQMRARLEQVFRASDYVLRWGGEEFLAVTRGSPRGDAPEIAERLRTAIAERPFLLDGGQPLAKTASIGFAAFPFVPSAPRAIPWSQVVDLADQALYLAKNGGRNAWAGIASTARTHAELLSRRLAESPEDAAGDDSLVVQRSESADRRDAPSSPRRDASQG
ncbi:MAG TPA: diguanylate cyclase [Thermoanaerobaculia bacterium]|nr:diguanylate cyclase [Thermoanaerobaculia bacterium]